MVDPFFSRASCSCQKINPEAQHLRLAMLVSKLVQKSIKVLFQYHHLGTVLNYSPNNLLVNRTPLLAKLTSV
jgi:hypothetical protein